MMNIFSTVGSYQQPTVPGENPKLQQSLMKSLETYIDQDDAYEIKKLLDVQENVEWIVKGLRQSPYSLLHQAAARRKDKALTAMMKKLPAVVWNFRTRENLEHTPPIKGGRTPLMFIAECNNGKMVFELFNAVSDYTFHCERDGTIQAKRRLDELRKEYNCWLPGDSAWSKIVNAQDDEENTPLLIAVKQGKFSSFYQLFLWHADPDIFNSDGETARRVILNSPGSPIHEKFLELTTPRMRCSIL